MLDLSNIVSLTEFQRNAKAQIDDIKKSGCPRVLTVNGRAELVVLDAASYQRLIELAEIGRTRTASVVAARVPAPEPQRTSTLADPSPTANADAIAHAMRELRRNFTTPHEVQSPRRAVKPAPAR
jgi:PHD/YefM family antitoxin component YafN of YafNO toxin-antitoxin module